MSDVHGSDDRAPAEAMIVAARVPPHAYPAQESHERLAACPNCDTPFEPDRSAPNFCPACGQEAVLHPPSVAEFAHEFVGHYVAVDGPLWRTLWLLLARPGELTREYLRGRRRRYVLPLRLYLSASFLFFLAFKLLPSEELVTPPRATAGHGTAAATLASPPSAASRPIILPGTGKDPDTPFECDTEGHACSWLRDKSRDIVHRWRTDPDAARAEFSAHWFGSAPYAVFLMQPVFASIVRLAYRRRRMLFGEHLVFAMHLHAFWFLAALAALLLPSGTEFLLTLGVFAYTLLALRRVYGGRWAPTCARAAFIAAVYGVLLGIASLAITVLAALH